MARSRTASLNWERRNPGICIFSKFHLNLKGLYSLRVTDQKIMLNSNSIFLLPTLPSPLLPYSPSFLTLPFFSSPTFLFTSLFLLWCWELNPGPYTYKTKALPWHHFPVLFGWFGSGGGRGTFKWIILLSRKS